ncbi:unnamed protein product [Medioppia subpectinata]|uniref:NADH dehydrogenase [ubiquinone] 1 beta subcomplex subunit 8, mitochondrial n=1 Tax=Medioppia subpectinata TaxID=1979941 RepID=A0A7R9Q305_9ACAR|nr:unnamed protein product [Medioppia subpectinata]CAG2109967.1 unnamed protein product [Medioppia subpectinata]
MAFIVRNALKISHLLANNGLKSNKTAYIAVRNCGWIRDWKPGPYPKTQEERDAAAKKYNLIPEDYETYPEGSGYGDYPKLPAVGEDVRDPYEDLDYHFRRRNYGETLNIDYDIYTSDRHNPNETLRYTPLQMVATFLGSFLFLYFLALTDTYFDLRNAWQLKPKQYPKPGVVHYTFEPLD